MTTILPPSISRPPSADAPWTRRLAYEARALLGRWRSPSAWTAPFPFVTLTLATLVAIMATRFAFEIDAEAIRATRSWSTGTVRFFRRVSDFGTSGWMFAVCAIIIVAAILARGRGWGLKVDAGLLALEQRALYVMAALATSGLLAQALKQIVGRGRPRLLDGAGPFTFDPFAGRSTYASFPSGHSTTAFCMAVALSFFLPRWRAPLFLLAGLIAFSRVAVGAHYPSDTIAGAYLGAVSAFLVAWAFARRDIAFTFRGGRLAARAMGAIMPALRRIFAGSR